MSNTLFCFLKTTHILYFLQDNSGSSSLLLKINDSLMFKLAMCDTTDFLSDPIPSKNQGGIDDTDPKPILNVLLYF